jgi:phosphoribosylaminoimidazole-succinocarboxamide synthase
MKKLALLYEGKAKRIYQTDEESIVWIEYKDDATAFNGEKKDVIAGKGRLNNEITSLIFEKIKPEVPNHFVKKLSETEQLVQKLTIIPLEVVVRNVAAGSLAKRLGLEEGLELSETIVEFYYKDDELGDPILTADHIRLLKIASDETVAEIREAAIKVNVILQQLFEKLNVRLIDFKLEFGRDKDGNVMLGDEISPDTCRLWDQATNQKLDKDVFRRGLGDLREGYTEILNRMLQEAK